MPPRRRETWGYRGVRARPSGGFSAEIRFRGMRLRWPHTTLNFPDVPTRERAQELVPLPRLITDDDRRNNQRQEHRLGIAEMDEEAMALWRQRFP